MQGLDYRHYIKRSYVDTGKPLIDIANNYKTWLLDYDKENPQNKGKGKVKGEVDYRQFDKDKFLYLSRTVDLTFEELCKIFKLSLTGARIITQDAVFTEQLYKDS